MTISLSQVRIASPCTMSWDDMVGDDRSRFCEQCHLNVYNLAAMTQAEAEALIREKEGRLCARLYQRADGTIITRDCPVGLARCRKAARWMMARIAAGVALACSAASWAIVYANPHREQSNLRGAQPITTLSRWLSPPPPVAPATYLLGRISAVPLPSANARRACSVRNIRAMNISLSQLRIASPCTASWDDMAGDDRARFCNECRLNVYNIAAMTQAEAEALIAETEGRLCARIYQRSDGTIITRDCPVGLARLRRAAWWTLSKVAAALAMTVGGAAWAVNYANPYREHARLASIQP